MGTTGDRFEAGLEQESGWDVKVRAQPYWSSSIRDEAFTERRNQQDCEVGDCDEDKISRISKQSYYDSTR